MLRWWAGGIAAALVCSGSAAYGAEPVQVTATEETPTTSPEATTAKKPKKEISDAEVIAALIAASRAAYLSGGPGPCGCPDDTDRAGHRCGKRSAHDRSGGWDVLCTPRDVTPEMIKAYRSSAK